MPLNIPSNGSTNNISFGPATIYMDAYDADGTISGTPSTDVGFIGEDGVTIELSSEKRNIVQGNPQLITYSFATAQSAMINFTSIEWNFEAFRLALGAGAAGEEAIAGGTQNYFSFGGNPLNTLVGLKVEHQMATTGDTLCAYVWKAQSESGFSLPFGSEEHQFEFSFQAIRATQNWGGDALAFDEQLLKLARIQATANPYA
jgi:hypothetical protein